MEDQPNLPPTEQVTMSKLERGEDSSIQQTLECYVCVKHCSKRKKKKKSKMKRESHTKYQNICFPITCLFKKFKV